MRPTENLRPIEVLLVEDSESDAMIVEEAFVDARIANKLQIAEDGDAARKYLFARPPFADRKRPDLILLDLNLPDIDGADLLSEVKNSDEFKSIPVVIMTTSSDREDIKQAYERQAAGFVTKPVLAGDFLAVLAEIQDYWFYVCRLPNGFH